MDNKKIQIIIIGAVAFLISLYLGISAVTAQIEVVMWVIASLTAITCLAMGKSIWLLIPLLGSLSLNFSLPGNPNTLLLAQLLCFSFSVILFLMRKLPYNLRFGELEAWALVLFALVMQVYMRNPVGLNIFGGDTVGGKAYFIFAISLYSFYYLAGLRVTESQLRWIYPLSVVGGLSHFFLFTVGHFVPKAGMWYGAADNAALGNVPSGTLDEKAAGRIQFVREPAKYFALWLCTRISPLRALLHPLWLIVLLTSVAFALMSGYRNMVASVAFTLMLGLLYRGGFIHILISGLLGVLGLMILAGVNLAFPLPPNAQRALAFLPGTWEERYILDTDDSTEWRVEIWEEVLLTDRWIQNKLLGDGLGFSRAELQLQMALIGSKNNNTGVSGFDAHREAILANGDYHSGPVQTVRTIGYVGLFFFLCAMIRLAVHAHRLIQRCRDTTWFPLTLLIGIPLIWAPAYFILIFGTFQTAVSAFFIGAGMIRLLENNLSLAPLARASHYAPLSLKGANS
jgi:hypothetical protein